MNECLTTPQHEKQIGYWVSEKGKCTVKGNIILLGYCHFKQMQIDVIKNVLINIYVLLRFVVYLNSSV